MAERWISNKHAFADSPPEIDAFLADIVEVYKKHNLSISHEDAHGGFLIEPLTQENINWLLDANDSRETA